MTRRLPILVCLVLLATVPASAQEETAEPAPTSAAKRHGIRPGSHEIQIFGGLFAGNMAYSSDKIVPPLNADPVEFRIELDDGTDFGLGYFYQVNERWAFGGSLARTSTEFAWETPFDRAGEEALLLASTVLSPSQGSELTDEQKLALLDRVEERSRPRSADLTMLDISAIYVFHPEGPWIAEVGAGLGWAAAEVDAEPMIWETLFHNECDPTDTNCALTIANELVSPATAGRCPTDDDPCVELDAASGLSWHALGGLRYAFSDAVQLRLGAKLRVLESVLDPGDTLVTMEGSLGLAFRFGGD